MSSINSSIPNTLSIGLGGNISSKAGSPEETLIRSRPLIEKAIEGWGFGLLPYNQKPSSIKTFIDFSWSPLYRTHPLGGPKGQPSFINAVLIVHGEGFNSLNPCVKAARNLLKILCSIEKDFGRDRDGSNIPWGPRSLDIDLLNWGELQVNTSELILPHPRLAERGFVIIPLAESIKKVTAPIMQLPPQQGWDE